MCVSTGAVRKGDAAPGNGLRVDMRLCAERADTARFFLVLMRLLWYMKSVT